MGTYADARKRMDEQAGPPPDETSTATSHRCAAHGCRLAGALAESSSARFWWCAYHYGAQAHDIPRITQQLAQHQVLVDTVATGRQALTDPAIAPDVQDDLWRNAKATLEQLGYTVPPAPRSGDDYRSWLYRVECLLGAQIVAARSLRRAA
jgi:hypothetical protein